MSNLTLTVVIPTYNSEVYLRACLDSVRRERHPAVEFILIDGGSTDGTMTVVDQNRELFTHVLSEKDSGQSEAFNKGFRLATGRYLTWLNSDDVLCEGSIGRTVQLLNASQRDWLTANSIYLDEQGCISKCCRSGGFESFAVKHGLLNVFGPSTFFTKQLYEELGQIDESFHFCMDSEYWWRIVESGRKYDRLNLYFWGLRLHKAAKTASVLISNETPLAMIEERSRIRARYFPEVTHRGTRCAVFWARIMRVLNLSYPKSYFDTRRCRGSSRVRS